MKALGETLVIGAIIVYIEYMRRRALHLRGHYMTGVLHWRGNRRSLPLKGGGEAGGIDDEDEGGA